MRRTVLLIPAFLLLTPAKWDLAPVARAEQPSVKKSVPWSCFRGDRHNTGLGLWRSSTREGAWVYETPPAVGLSRGIYSSPAMGEEGTVYIGASRLYALDALSGRKKWQFYVGGATFNGTPALSEDNWLYIGCDDLHFYALDARNANIRWQFTGNGRFVSSPALDAEGRVYVGCGDHFLYALNAKTGKLHWKYSTPHSIEASPLIGENGLVYCQNWGGLSALYRKDGAVAWTYKVDDDLYSNSTPSLGSEGAIYAVFVLKGATKDGAARVVALDAATGKFRWEKHLPLYAFASPTVGAEGLLYVGCGDGKLYALEEKSGRIRWTFATGEHIQASPAIGADGTVYVASYDQKLYAVNGKTGKKKWEASLGSGIQSSPIVSRGGTVFVGSLDGNFYAIRPGAKPLPGKFTP